MYLQQLAYKDNNNDIPKFSESHSAINQKYGNEYNLKVHKKPATTWATITHILKKHDTNNKTMLDNANHIARITIDNEIVTLKLTDKKYGSEINLTNSNKQKLSLLSNNITKYIYKALKK